VGNSRKAKTALLVFCDILVSGVCIILSLFIVEGNLDNLNIIFASTILLQILALLVSGVYKVSIVDSSFELAIRGLGLILADLLGFFFCYKGKLLTPYGFRVFFVFMVLSYVSIVGYRVIYRYFIYQKNKRKFGFIDKTGFHDIRRKALVYGAGELGKTLALQSRKGKLHYNVIGFIDDDKEKQGTLILNCPVFGGINSIGKTVKITQSEVLIIAITQLSAQQMQKAVALTVEANAEVKIVPSLFEINSGIKKLIDLRTVDYADLLGRELVNIDKKPIMGMLEDKVVLVTGACGSIGSEICRQIRTYKPKKLLLLDIDESGLHDSALRLLNYKSEWSDEVVPILCDIKNEEKLNFIMKKYKPEIVFHAAAYKHVPMIQLYPEEGIKTNVSGSFNVLKVSKENGVKKVVVISTDKAVNPTNVMGATKRLVELEAAMLNSTETKIVCVRFGNVIGSRGSMLPLFIEEIQAGVPITVTDKKIIRYFMAIPEAVSLVFLAATLGQGGEVMALDMGEPVNIYEFAKKLVNIYGDERKNKITITGLRPGEKLYEELLADKDTTIPTENKLIFKAKVKGSLDMEEFLQKLAVMDYQNPDKLRAWLKETVPEFHEEN